MRFPVEISVNRPVYLDDSSLSSSAVDRRFCIGLHDPSHFVHSRPTLPCERDSALYKRSTSRSLPLTRTTYTSDLAPSKHSFLITNRHYFFDHEGAYAGAWEKLGQAFMLVILNLSAIIHQPAVYFHWWSHRHSQHSVFEKTISMLKEHGILGRRWRWTK